MKNKIFKTLLAIFICLSCQAQAQKMTVGEEVLIKYESPHPYLGKSRESITWEQEVTYTEKQATYIALHFETLKLAPGDLLVVTSPDGSRRWEYDQTSNNRGAFWSIPIYGNTAVVKIYASSKDGSYGYIIDKIARGFTKQEVQDVNSPESICGDDDSMEAKCYETSEPEVYEHSRAVARLWLNGVVNCTGWLVGDEGHLMTCNHCIGDQNDANNTTVEMMAEGATCGTNCQTAGGCGGDIVANSVTMIQTGCQLDYSLVLLPTNVSSTYGFLQMRSDGPSLNERIYVPQHPAGFGKRIALSSDNVADTDGFAHVQSITQPSCWCSGSSTLLGYFADTRGGSSGSPVIGYDDHLVIGLHGCGGCPNRGNNIGLIIQDLDYVPNNAVFKDICDGPYIATHINTNTLFNTDMNMPGDIYVHSGAELLIEAKIGMREGARILVERNARLVVDNGGIVTRGCDAPDWAGIQVLGNSQKAQPERFAPLTDLEQAGIVWIDNATIEWARCGVTAGGGYGPEFWGGLVWTNKTLFRNNRKDVEFMSYKFTTNKSRFFHTKFIEDGDAFANTEGVTIWETDDIEFHNCTFSNMDFEGIRTYDAGVRVLNSNVFQDNETGISSYATYPMTNKIYIGSGTSTENMFSNNKYHVHASLATGLFGLYSNGKFSLDVVNNNFSGGEYGVIVDGPSNFGVAGNLFAGVPIGTWAANTGYNNLFNQNLIGCNRYNGGSNLGILAIGENKEMQFLANDFDMSASGRDFILTNSFFPFLNGSIASQQGNPFVSASNCFTNPGTQADVLTWGTTNPFVYFYPGGEPDPACEQEPLTLGNYTKQAIKPGPFVVDCSRYGGLPRGMGEPDPRDLETRRKELQLLAQGTAGGDANAAAKYYQLLQEKEAILKYLLTQSLENKDFKTTEELLKGEGSTAADWAIFGLRMERKAYDEAAAWLNELPARNETELEFKAVQQINLERLQKPEGFQLSEDQEAYLTSVAESGSPVRGYARGILGLLKDRRFYPEAYEIGDGKKEAQERSAMVAPNAGLKTFPSPVSDNLTVTWPSLSQGATVELKVIDMLGKVRMQAAVGNGAVQHNLAVTPLDNGVYNLILVENGKAVQRTKFVVQK